MTLSTLYDMSSNKFFIELRKFRARLKAFKMKFKNFASLAEYILKTLNDTEYPILRKLTAILLVLPFCTADCERAFSAMNRIKSPERSKLKSILKTLMLAYTAQDHEKENLDIEKFSRDISTDLRKKDGKKSYFENDFIV